MVRTCHPCAWVVTPSSFFHPSQFYLRIFPPLVTHEKIVHLLGFQFEGFGLKLKTRNNWRWRDSWKKKLMLSSNSY
ncbi:hypothetical protein MKW98_014728 [Papaver atlanticum]|uniref:Uncharacterized protein n=1 Tax=Papaver atlanticum TaxID=357466 RepID=A0AAD4XDV9_9MAGN|nr:hypothetical protein MKW98_014728 [Papaver atlanticum]